MKLGGIPKLSSLIVSLATAFVSVLIFYFSLTITPKHHKHEDYICNLLDKLNMKPSVLVILFVFILAVLFGSYSPSEGSDEIEIFGSYSPSEGSDEIEILSLSKAAGDEDAFDYNEQCESFLYRHNTICYSLPPQSLTTTPMMQVGFKPGLSGHPTARPEDTCNEQYESDEEYEHAEECSDNEIVDSEIREGGDDLMERCEDLISKVHNEWRAEWLAEWPMIKDT